MVRHHLETFLADTAAADPDGEGVPRWVEDDFRALIGYNAVRHIGNTRTGVFSNFVPAVAMRVAWIRLGELPGSGQLAGAVVTIGGVTLAQRRPGPRGPARG